MIAANPATAGSVDPGSMRAASQTLAAPLAMSSAATTTPAATPETRITFAAPRLPLPARRRSDPPQRRAQISANGIDPIRYPATIAMAIVVREVPDARGPAAQAQLRRPVRLARASAV